MADGVNLKNAERRDLNFTSIDDVLADMQRILEAERDGVLRKTGNWSVGQIFQHVGKFIRFSYDGFPFTAPLPIRLFGMLIKPFALTNRPIPAGMGLPGDSAKLLPDNVVATQEGAEELQAQLQRIKSGEQMTAKSPLFGRFSHEQWVGMHLKHAAHHFSYLHPES